MTILGTTAAHSADTTGDDGVLSGTQVVADILAPVTVVGNAVSVVGDSTVGSPAAAAPVVPAPVAAPAPAPVAAAPSTSGSDSVAGGTQAVMDAAASVTVTDNAINIIGGSVVGEPAPAPAPAPVAPAAPVVPATPAPAAAPASTRSGDDSIGGGTQTGPVLDIPVTIGDNAISVIGDSETNTPVVPTEPVNPTDPTEPVNPADPVTPVTPVTPTEPTGPVTPTEPTETATPAVPADAATRAVPAETGTATEVAALVTVADNGAAASALAAPGSLAQTGVDGAPIGILALLLLIAGATLVTTSRRNAIS
ncbi:chaplin family protein [Marisediminicola senii]|uniref:chaplin family protein n=1 Tax=Marisediminicola senii TaxID=2711233 RepID=UPI0013E9AF1A|nr:chaplin family protein [Marisediminicola senii]